MKHIFTAVISSLLITNLAQAGLTKSIMTSTEEVLDYIKLGVPKIEKTVSLKEGSLLSETINTRKSVSVVSAYRFEDHTLFLMNVESKLNAETISLRIDVVQTLSAAQQRNILSRQNRIKNSRLDVDQVMDMTNTEASKIGQIAIENLSRLDLDMAGVAKSNPNRIILTPHSADAIRYVDQASGGSAGAVYSIRLELPKNVTREELERILSVVANAI